VTQEHVFLLSPAPAADAPLRYAADTLALALGDDSGSRLYWALVDPGLADSADTGFHDYEGAGSFCTSFSCDPSRVKKNMAIVFKVFRDIQKNGLSDDELQQAKSKILSRVVRGSERPMGRMQAIGMSWTYLRKYRTVEEEIAAFDAVTLKSIRKVLDKYPLDQVTALALGPLKKLQRPGGNGRR
jgi:predicted Zn-dependent peptidase